MKKIVYLLLATMMAACGNENDFPKIDPPVPIVPGTTDGGVALFGEYEGTPAELVGAFGTTDLKTFDIAFNDAAVTETETVIVAPAAGYEDFVENYGYDETTGETDNAVKTLKFTYVSGLIQVQYYSKKGNLKATFTSSRTVTDDDTGEEEAHVEIKGQRVTVKALKRFNYVLTGTGKEGSSFKVYSDKKFQLTLDNVSLHNNQGAAINLQKSFNPEADGKHKGKRAYIILKGTNTLKDSKADAYAVAKHPQSGEEEDEKGVIFSEGKLLVSGTGTLNIVAQGKHGIVSDDYLYMHAGPSVSITPAAGYDAVKTNDGIIIAGGVHNYAMVGAGSKGLNSDSTITLTGGRLTVVASESANSADLSSQTAVDGSRVVVAGGELFVKTQGTGIDAGDVFAMDGGTVKIISGDAKAGGTVAAVESDEVYVNGGTLTMRAGNGIDADNRITVVGGMTEAYCAGKALHAFRNIQVKGGGIYACSVSDDVIVSDGIIGIAGGVVYANAMNSLKAGIDCKDNLFDIDGGTLIAIGGMNSAPTLPDSEQAAIARKVLADAVADGSAGTLNGVMADDGTCLAAFKAENSDGVAVKDVLFSAPGMTVYDSCSMTTGGTATLVTGGVSFHDVYANGVTLSGASIVPIR